MTVNTSIITAGPYVGNGNANTFNYNFKIEDKTQLIVYEYETTDTSNYVILTVDTDYTVNDVGDSSGSITRVAGALPTNKSIFIVLNYPYTQLTDFNSQGAFFPENHEDALDKLTYLVLQLLEELKRTVKISSPVPPEEPIRIPIGESLKVLRWNQDGTQLENFDTEAAYVNVDGDTMTSPLKGPNAVENDDYITKGQSDSTYVNVDGDTMTSPLKGPNAVENDDYITKGQSDSTYVNVAGDTMTSPLKGPNAVENDDYTTKGQVSVLVDDAIESLPGFDPGQLIDYGLVTGEVTDDEDYGSVA